MNPRILATGLPALFALPAFAQTFAPPASLEAGPLEALARQVLADPDPEGAMGPDQRFRIQLQARDLEGALETMGRLRASRKEDEPRRGLATRQHELFARTRLLEAAGRTPEAALAEAFAAMEGPMGNPASYQFALAIRGNAENAARDLRALWENLKAKERLSLDEAVRLLRAAQTRDTYARILPSAAALMTEAEGRRYAIDEDVHVRTKDGATLCATVVRPKAAGPLPTAFEFTIYANEFNRTEALHSASEGFAGVVATSRGKRHSPDAVAPYEHDGADAAGVIAWIARQPWSDGQVGMYGGSYDGFTQWAAAKHRPAALKSLMPCVPVAPGIDTPMEGGVFQNYAYSWIPYVTNTRLLDEADYSDWKRWNGLDWAWFESGRPYRELPDVDGRPNPLWLRWLAHPTYDAYWQAMVPYGEEFARVDIPVLTTTGYFDGCSLSALYYFTEHTRRQGAEHYFLIGPYDHIGGQRGSVDVVGGYTIDPAARLDIEALRYQWLDHTLRGGPRPAALKDRVNVQVMGANTWRHAPTVAALATGSLTLHLDPAEADGMRRLSPRPPASRSDLAFTADLKDRKTLSFPGPADMEGREIDASNGLAFATAPLEAPLEVSGCFSGRLAFITNKRDLDLSLQLYERTADGRYLFLSHLLARASQLPDRHRRRLLRPGQRTVLPFRSGRLVSRRLAKGSRVVFVVSVVKEPRAQVNYGTGRDVSSESVSEAGEPVRVSLGRGCRLSLPIAGPMP